MLDIEPRNRDRLESSSSSDLPSANSNSQASLQQITFAELNLKTSELYETIERSSRRRWLTKTNRRRQKQGSVGAAVRSLWPSHLCCCVACSSCSNCMNRSEWLVRSAAALARTSSSAWPPVAVEAEAELLAARSCCTSDTNSLKVPLGSRL